MIGKTKLVAAATVVIALSAQAAELLNENYDLENPGSAPSADVVKPTVNTSILFVKVVDGTVNTAGSGNGVQIYDYDAVSGSATAMEYDFVANVASQESLVRADFAFSYLGGDTNATKFMTAAFGEFGTSLGSKAARWNEIRFYPDGTISLSGGSGDIDISPANSSHTISMFVNDLDGEGVNYIGLDGSTNYLDANAVAYWLDGALTSKTSLDVDDAGSGGLIGASTNNFGKLGFNSGSSETGLNYAFDDVVVSTYENIYVAPTKVPDNILYLNYENDVVGAQPGPPVAGIRPNSNNALCFVKIVDGTNNIAGTGNGVQLFDNAGSGVSDNSLSMEYNFVSNNASQVSAVRVDMNFAYVSKNGPGDRAINLGLGEWAAGRNMNSSSRRFTDVRFYNDGTIDFRRNEPPSTPDGSPSNVMTNYPFSENNPVLPGANTLSMFVNDYDAQSVEYTGLDGDTYTLPTNSIAYWLNNSLVLMMDDNQTNEYIIMDWFDVTVTSGGIVMDTENNLGKIGFYSGSTEYENNYVFDDILVTTNLLFTIDSYEEWLDLYPALIGSGATNYMDDLDADLMNNLLEFALGANPTTNDAAGFWPTYLDNGAGLDYVYNRRDNADVIGMTYAVLSDTDLVTGSITTPTVELGSSEAAPGFEVVTNQIYYADSPQAFMQLKVELD